MTTSRSSIQFLNPTTLPQAVGFTQVVEARGCRTIYISGQVALDASGSVVGPGELYVQTVQVFKNLEAALAAIGANFEQVVKLTYYLLDISQIAMVRAVRDQYVNTQRPPASSAVEVRRLFRDDLLIKVEAIAVLAE